MTVVACWWITNATRPTQCVHPLASVRLPALRLAIEVAEQGRALPLAGSCSLQRPRRAALGNGSSPEESLELPQSAQGLTSVRYAPSPEPAKAAAASAPRHRKAP